MAMTADIILHPSVLTRPDWLEALDKIEHDCGPVTVGPDSALIDIHHVEFNPEPAA